MVTMEQFQAAIAAIAAELQRLRDLIAAGGLTPEQEAEILAALDALIAQGQAAAKGKIG